MSKTAIRIRENNNSNVEVLMRILMCILTIRGTAFIYRNINGEGGELLIFLDKKFLIGEILESTDFQSYPMSTISATLELVNDKSHTNTVQVEYNISIIETTTTKMEL